MEQDPGAQRAIKAVGSQTRLAELLGISQAAVSFWLRNGIPAHRVIKLERLTGVPREELRPDLYEKRRDQ